MREKTEISQAVRAEVSQWVNQLLASTGQQRQQAASELGRLGVWTRGSVRTRGSLRTPAANRLPEPEKLSSIVRCLEDADPDVRCQVALALSEWGGEGAAKALCQMLQTDADEEVQLYCITAFRTIGGVTAAEGLRWAIEHGTDAVRDAAMGAIEELVTGGSPEDTEGPPVPQRTASAGLRTRGAVRTRGPQTSADVMGSLVTTLQRLRAEDTTSDSLRYKAADVLAYLGE